ncbi:MAG: PIN domain-containing protein [Nitrospiraceae bacterium]|nr:PIN domain-containing protein [Nitrospiraceae bacterium]
MLLIFVQLIYLPFLTQGGGQLSADVCQRIREAPIVYVSAISGFEIGIKYEKRKLILPALPADWFKIIIKHHDLQILPLDLQVCIRSTQLPAIHNDPCDRMIIASAELHHLTVITGDSTFKKYGIETKC